MKISTTLLACVSSSSIYVDNREANAFLRRSRRAWTELLEEASPGDWERECIEEDCNTNEAYEVYDHAAKGERLHKLTYDCKRDFRTKASQSTCVRNGLRASWSEWSEWSACSATCIDSVIHSLPFRERHRNCKPGVETLTCEFNEMSRTASSISISSDDGHDVQSISEPCHAEKCVALESNLEITRDIRNTVIAKLSWSDLRRIDRSGELKIYWRINREVFANYDGRSKQVSYYASAPASLRRRSEIIVDEEGRWAELRITPALSSQDEGMRISTEIQYEGFYDAQAANFLS